MWVREGWAVAYATVYLSRPMDKSIVFSLPPLPEFWSWISGYQACAASRWAILLAADGSSLTWFVFSISVTSLSPRYISRCVCCISGSLWIFSWALVTEPIMASSSSLLPTCIPHIGLSFAENHPENFTGWGVMGECSNVNVPNDEAILFLWIDTKEF